MVAKGHNARRVSSGLVARQPAQRHGWNRGFAHGDGGDLAIIPQADPYKVWHVANRLRHVNAPCCKNACRVAKARHVAYG